MNSDQVFTEESIEQQKIHHRLIFDEWLNESYKDKPKSKIIDRNRMTLYMNILKNRETNVEPSLKFYIKSQKFNIVTEDNVEILSRINKGINLPVAIKEEFFDIIYTVHSIQRGHVGIQKIHKQMGLRYYGMMLI